MALDKGTAQGETDKVSAQAHHTDTTSASKTLLEDAKNLRSSSNGANTTLSERDRTQVTDLNRSLQEAGLLPSLTLTLAQQEFDNIDGKAGTGRDKKIDIDEVKAAAAAAETRSPGSLDAMLYGELYKQMKAGTIPSEMDKDQLELKLKSINEGFQKGDKENARDLAKLLTDKPELLRAIDIAGGVQDSADPVISKDDIDKYLKRTDISDEERSKLTWLSKNWDDPDLKPLKNNEGYLNRQSLTNGIAALDKDLAALSPSPVNAEEAAKEASRVATINNTPEARALKTKGYTLDPNDRGHDEVYRAPDGTIIAIDRDAAGKPIAYTYGDGKNNYTGYKLIHDSTGKTPDRWDYYDGTVDSATGKMKAVKTVPSMKLVGGIPVPDDYT